MDKYEENPDEIINEIIKQKSKTMDKDRAYTEIQSILGHVKNQNLTYEEQMKQIEQILIYLSKHQYQAGFKNGMIVSKSLIEDFIKKEL